MINAIITVTRFDSAEECEIDINVEVSGQTERYSSYNSDECGEHISDWSVDYPKGFELTSDEERRAIDALENNI